MTRWFLQENLLLYPRGLWKFSKWGGVLSVMMLLVYWKWISRTDRQMDRPSKCGKRRQGWDPGSTQMFSAFFPAFPYVRNFS